jgi:hypothetical protein
MGIHSKCGAFVEYEGWSVMMCGRSPGHTESKNEQRRRHYDPGAEKSWDAEHVYDEDGVVIPTDRPRVLEGAGRSA